MRGTWSGGARRASSAAGVDSTRANPNAAWKVKPDAAGSSARPGAIETPAACGRWSQPQGHGLTSERPDAAAEVVVSGLPWWPAWVA